MPKSHTSQHNTSDGAKHRTLKDDAPFGSRAPCDCAERSAASGDWASERVKGNRPENLVFGLVTSILLHSVLFLRNDYWLRAFAPKQKLSEPIPIEYVEVPLNEKTKTPPETSRRAAFDSVAGGKAKPQRPVSAAKSAQPTAPKASNASKVFLPEQTQQKTVSSNPPPQKLQPKPQKITIAPTSKPPEPSPTAISPTSKPLALKLRQTAVAPTSKPPEPSPTAISPTSKPLALKLRQTAITPTSKPPEPSPTAITPTSKPLALKLRQTAITPTSKPLALKLRQTAVAPTSKPPEPSPTAISPTSKPLALKLRQTAVAPTSKPPEPSPTAISPTSKPLALKLRQTAVAPTSKPPEPLTRRENRSRLAAKSSLEQLENRTNSPVPQRTQRMAPSRFQSQPTTLRKLSRVQPSSKSGGASSLGGPISLSHRDFASNNLAALPNPNRLNRSTQGIDARQDANISAYLQQLQEQVRQQWIPGLTQSSQRTVLHFTVSRAGLVSNLRIAQTSGLSVTDEAALSAVKRATPFAPFPTGYTKNYINIQFTFNINVYGQLELWRNGQ